MDEVKELYQRGGHSKEVSVGMFSHIQMSGGWRVGWTEQRTVEKRHSIPEGMEDL